MNWKAAFKQSLLPAGERPIRIRAGLYRGLRLRLAPRDSMQMVLGLYEVETNAFLRRRLQDAAWMIDIGAGRGEMALLFALHRIPAMAVEPGAAILDVAGNAALNDVREGSLFTIERRCVGISSAPNYVALDALAAGRSGPGFVKIDVDGVETDVLNSGAHLVAGRTSCFLVETHSPQLEQECAALLSRAGYKVRIVRNAWWRRILPEWRSPAHNRWLTAEPVSG